MKMQIWDLGNVLNYHLSGCCLDPDSCLGYYLERLIYDEKLLFRFMGKIITVKLDLFPREDKMVGMSIFSNGDPQPWFCGVIRDLREFEHHLIEVYEVISFSWRRLEAKTKRPC